MTVTGYSKKEFTPILRSFSLIIFTSLLLTTFAVQSAEKKSTNKKVSAEKNTSSLIKGGKYQFQIHSLQFSIPDSFVETYTCTNGQKSPTQKNCSKQLEFNLLASLPSLKALPKKGSSKGEEQISISIFGINTNQAKTFHSWTEFYKEYDLPKIHEQNQAPTIVSTNPRTETYQIGGNTKYVLINQKLVERYMLCAPEAMQKKADTTSGCQVSMMYADKVSIELYFSRKYEKDWLMIANKVEELLKSYQVTPR